MSEPKKRGGWSNPASAANGRKAVNGGRPVSKATFRRGESLIVERQTIGGLDPFRPPERGVILSVGADEIEIEIGDDILTLRRDD